MDSAQSAQPVNNPPVQDRPVQTPPPQKSHIPMILVIVGSIQLIGLIFFYFTFLKTLFSVYQTVMYTDPPLQARLIPLLFLMLSLIDFFSGLFLSRKQYKQGLTQRSRKIGTILLGASLILIGIYFVMSIFIYISSTYNLLNSYKNDSPQTMLQKEFLSPPPLPASDPTANWKTYTDTKYGFSLKYPSTWIEIQSTNSAILEEKIKRSFSTNGIEISMYDGAGNFSVLDFLEKIYYKKVETNQISKEFYEKYVEDYRQRQTYYFKTISVGNQNVTYITDLDLAPGSQGAGVWITHNGYGLLLRSYPSADAQNQEKIFNQILQTFKFTDQNQTFYCDLPIPGSLNRTCPDGYKCTLVREKQQTQDNLTGICVKQ